MQRRPAPTTPAIVAEIRLLARNRLFYDQLWADARLITPDRFATWPLVRSLLDPAVPRLEVGPGLRPRLPIERTCFADISRAALGKLRRLGGQAVCGTASSLPFPDGCFGLLCALDVIEHVADDEAAFAELGRVAAEGAVLLLSVPLHRSAWSSFDRMVGHHRRYDPDELVAKLERHGFRVERSAGFGMRPRSSRLASLGLWFLSRRRAHAMQWYNRLLVPLALRRQQPLCLRDGLVETDPLSEVFLVCRHSCGPAGAATPGAAPAAVRLPRASRRIPCARK